MNMRNKEVDATNYWESVVTHSERQFVTGKEPNQGNFLSDNVYSQALDELVIGCADIIPVWNGRMLIGRRSWEPQPDWWCFGGRMRKGELYQVAAARNVKRELFHGVEGVEIALHRFALVGVYNLIWEKRAQAPIEHGCHTLSVTMMLSLTEKEAISLHLNEEYNDIRWLFPDEIILNPDAYHPCLSQMAKDVSMLLSIPTRL